MHSTGYWNFAGNSTTQTSYRAQFQGASGINLNASEGLSSGQKTTVLRATGDKQWVDSYGIFKSNSNTVAENITIPANINCISAGPITIANGYTVTINSGGNWAIV